jgi:hypothetical protein
MLFKGRKRILQFSFIFLMAVVAVQALRAQETPGITQGNFAGSQMVHLNPANMLQSKAFFDLQLLSAAAFAQNNFVYIPANDYRTYQALNSNVELPVYESGNNFLYRGGENRRFASVVSRAGGPSGMLIRGDHAFALNTGVRAFTNATRVPFEIPIFGIEGLGYSPLQNIRFQNTNLNTASMAWGEIGLSYAYAFHKSFRDHWAAGITVKRLMGHSAAFVQVEEMDYVVIDNRTINIINMNATAGLAIPVDYNDNTFPDSGPLIKGGGFGFDLGITLTRKKQGIQRYNPIRICEQPFTDYEFRLGISLIDIGSINFSNSSQLHQYENVGLLWERVDTIDFENLNTLTGQLSALFHDGDTDATLADNSFRLGLPTALSIQFDYNFMQNWYLNTLIIHPIPLNEYSLVRPAQLAVAPRYETDWFEFGLPVSLYDYRIPRVGAFVRLGFITLGTDRLGTIFGISDIDGVDFYASVKINLRRGVCIGGNDSGACSNDDNYRRAMKRRLGWR